MPALTDPVAPESKRFDFPVFLAVCLCFFVYGAIAAPVPAVNEPHYLTKARHYWQPDWCAPDFFLQSSNAHTVFFATIGSLTQWFSLEQSAWIGRLLAMIVLAAGWCHLMSTLANCRWFAVHVAWMFLVFESVGNFSGEWLVGGVEGKVFCYGLLFASLGQVLRGRNLTAGILAGLAIAIHPVVGVWGVLAFAGAVILGVLFQKLASRKLAFGQIQATPVTAHPIPWFSLTVAFAALVACSLPGLIPVFRLLAEPLDPETKFAATYIQVYYRLAHHLDPMLFPARAYLGYAVLIAVWAVGMLATKRNDQRKVLDRIVGFAILFALAGIVIGWGPRPAGKMPYFAERAQLLKFYPFRLADVLVPVAVSTAIVAWVHTWPGRFLKLAGFGILFVAALFRAHSIVETNRYSKDVRADWLDACRWIEKNLPANAVVQAPHNGWAFKWFAKRAEYVSFKDCPQDGAGIVEWNRRLNFLKHWYEDHYTDQFYSATELKELRHETGITHLLTDRLGPLELQPIYRNAAFQIYDLTSLQ